MLDLVKSASQIARILTEDWLARNMYCPICGEVSIKRAEPNAPVKDYICDNCKAQYELKSKREHSDKYVTKVNDGVYRTMIDRITSLDNPSFFFMHYDGYEVNNLIIVPKCFFIPEVIENVLQCQIAHEELDGKDAISFLNKFRSSRRFPL